MLAVFIQIIWVFCIWFLWLKTDFSKRFYRGCTWGEKNALLEWLWLIILIGIHSDSVQNAFGLFVFNGQRRCKNSDENAVPTRKRMDSPSLGKIETISHLWVCAKMNSWKAEMSWTSKTPSLHFFTLSLHSWYWTTCWCSWAEVWVQFQINIWKKQLECTACIALYIL